MLTKLQSPDWQSLTRNWQNGQLKLALTAHLLKLRTELADLFRDGDYQPLNVRGPHRDHVIAFARRRGSQAAIIAVARLFAPFSQAGRVWPAAGSFDGAIDVSGFAVDGAAARNTPELRLSDIFRDLPAVALKAQVESVSLRHRKRISA